MSALRSLLRIVAGLMKSRPAASPPRPSPSTSKPRQSTSTPEPPVASAPSARGAGDPVPSRGAPTDAGDRIRGRVTEWRGVPYQMGGTSRQGVDCSAFVRTMYDDLFSCKLPRTSTDQAQQGREVSRSDLEPGDLVFFKISDRTRHVGAYVGNGEFGHASTSRGPVVSKLDSDYWKQRYWTARRIF